MTVAEYAAVAAAITVAYVVFGLTGFGATMVAVPVLVQFVPLRFAVPLMLMLDLMSTTLIGLGNRKKVSRAELTRLAPFLLVGVAIGATLLATVASRWLLLALGVFVIAMAARNLFASKSEAPPISARWVFPAGVIGGVFSALFGTGGPIYTMYLSRRLAFEEFRATVAATIFLSALVRFCAFAAAGLLTQPDLLLSAAGAAPFALLGLTVGSRLRHRVPEAALKRALLVLLICAGVAVLVRAMSI